MGSCAARDFVAFQRMGEPSGFELGVWGGVGKASHREGLEFRLARLRVEGSLADHGAAQL